MIQGENYTIHIGNNLDILPTLQDCSVDSIVTDPPYELGFMGKKWDNTGIAYNIDLWRECLRVLKPGGHLLAFSGSRTYHRMVVAIEDAGFEIRDMIAWISNKTFPKSQNIAKAIDKQAGARENVSKGFVVAGDYNSRDLKSPNRDYQDPALVTTAAKQWEGWGTALKPTVEPIVMARKPLIGTVAENVLTYGTGGLNIDASRIGTEEITINTFDNGAKPFGDAVGEPYTSRQSQGRWPANVILDEYSAELLDEQSGISKDGVAVSRNRNPEEFMPMSVFGKYKNLTQDVGYGGSGGASRFFYVARASKRDRNEGLEQSNTHPTVKPTDLMRYLIKLVTPPNGIVLDPFTGSGSTGKAAILEGFRFIGIEMTEDYIPIIEGRLKHAADERSEGLF
jgi:DNA modification methylase